MSLTLVLIFAISIFALAFAVFLIKNVMKRDTGTPKMQEISNAIKEGAEAFLRRQNRTILYLAVATTALVYLLYTFQKPELAFWAALSFILGALSSVASGYIGMWISIRANIRTASEAMKSLNGALQTALRAGAVSGLFIVAMSLLGVVSLFYIVLTFSNHPVEKIPFFIAGYGFGASFVALFAQLGGGIYTKAADVGADLVGKVEAGIPEDDPRNPAVIADLVGDNVGDCAGRGADLFESTAAENIGAMILAAMLFKSNPGAFGNEPAILLLVILFPLLARAFGLISSIVGIMSVKAKETEDPMNALNRGFYVTSILAMIGFGVASYWIFGTGSVATAAPTAWWHFFICGIIGVVTSVIFLWITQYYTEYKYNPVKSIAEAAKTGPATTIISGVAVGFECVAIPAVVIAAAIFASYTLGNTIHGLEEAGFFATAVATMGMLGPAAYVLAMDTFGPITDNAGGIVEMSQQPEEIRRMTDRLDAVGNTTKALTKGYAVGSAALAAFLLYQAFIVEIKEYGGSLNQVDITKPAVFIGALMGATLVFLFSAWAIKAVGRAAQTIIQNVRDQFKAKPGILLGTEKPDYAQAVDIVTRSALKEMVKPGVLVVLAPVVVGVTFKLLYRADLSNASGAEVVAAMLLVGTIVGVITALFLNNSGGAWDNAKKYIEMEVSDIANNMGKGSEKHKASVVGDTVGDPFKDTAGPSLHVLIKLLSTVTLVLAPLFI
ncbi:MAG: sodium-translocating pyrophosphatase [Ignavibacteria bacterium]|nr:sodium-translocating pyrophosphatase [Ignavibacteria bacterium]